MLIPREISAPKNESDLHFFLKQVALAILAERFKCRLIATEVYLPDINKDREALRQKHFPNHKGIYSDAVGLNVKQINFKKAINEYTVRSIEVKISRQDFNNGYCIDGDLNYVLVPKGLVDPKELFPGVGLIEVDLKKLRFYRSGKLLGVEITKRPQRVKSDDIRRIDSITNALMHRSKNHMIWHNPWFYPGFNKRKNEKFLKDLER